MIKCPKHLSLHTKREILIFRVNHSFVLYGFRNSIWAAYVPLFLALLISQKTNSQNQYLFFLIGGLVTLGVLLREPFLFFYLVSDLYPPEVICPIWSEGQTLNP